MKTLVLSAIATLSALALLPIATPARPEPLSEITQLTAATDNDSRFEALTAFLRTHQVPYAVEPFDLDRPVQGEARTRGRNLVVTLGDGMDEILIGAHYDAARLRDGSLSRGAVDNGASCVALARVAETLLANPPAVRVKIVWFDMEEIGLRGSSHYVTAHAGDRVRAVINIDIAAYGDTLLFSAPPGGEDQGLQRVFVENCAAEGIDCLRFPKLPAGDDRSFGQAKIPTLSVAMLPATEAHQLWLNLNAGANSGLRPDFAPAIFAAIHTAGDVAAKVDGQSLERIEQFLQSLVRRLSQQQT